MVTIKNKLIDLNRLACYFGAPTRGAANELRQNRLFSAHGIPARLRIPQMCQTLQRRLQDQKFFLHGSISLHGLCAADLSRESARHRSVSQVDALPTLSHGNSLPSVPQHAFKRQLSK